MTYKSVYSAIKSYKLVYKHFTKKYVRFQKIQNSVDNHYDFRRAGNDFF